MTVTVLKLSDADTYLKNISIKNIKDVRALDVDLMLVLRNGDSIIISNGAVSAMSAPESSLQFADGKLPLASVFQQIDKIDVSPEANLTVSSKEITRYNQNNARNKKARKDDEEAADKPVVIDDGEHDPRAAAQTSGSGGNTEQTNFTPTKSPDNQSQIADAEINSQQEKNWGVQWPIAAGAQAEGASLFAKPIATPTDNDTKSIQLSFANGTLAVTLDKLVLGSYTLAFDTSAPANLVQTIAGVRDVAISYTRTPSSACDLNQP